MRRPTEIKKSWLRPGGGSGGSGGGGSSSRDAATTMQADGRSRRARNVKWRIISKRLLMQQHNSRLGLAAG